MAGALTLVQHGHTTDGRDIVNVTTRPCVVCGEIHQFSLDYDKFQAWQNGMKIQDAFPEMSVADREILISGTCDECFNTLFPPEPDE